MKLGGLVDEQTFQAYIERYDRELYASVSKAVKRHTPSEVFGFSSSGIQDRHIPKFVELINQNPEINILCLDHNNIGNQGFLYLATHAKHIDTLYFSYTDIGDDSKTSAETIRALAMSTIKHLHAGRTALTNAEADILIQHSRQITLSFRSNRRIDDERVRLLEAQAKQNSAEQLKDALLGGSRQKKRKVDSVSNGESHTEDTQNGLYRK